MNILDRAVEIKADLTELMNLGDAPIGEHWAVCIKKSQLRDAIALIEALEGKVAELTRELDSALYDLHQRVESEGVACDCCAHNTDDPGDCPQEDEECDFCDYWKWRGLEENNV